MRPPPPPPAPNVEVGQVAEMEANPRRGRARPDGSRGLPAVSSRGRGTLVLVATVASIASRRHSLVILFDPPFASRRAFRYVMSKSNRFDLLAGLFADRSCCGSRVLHVFLPSDFRAPHVTFHQTVPNYQSVSALIV
jgi:hypothetical protein